MKTTTLETTVRNRHPHRSALHILALLLLPQIIACAPRQFGSDQVPDVNVAVTALKDEASAGMPASVDQVMSAFLAQDGSPPGCAVGIMEDDELAYVKGYGFADLASHTPFTHATPAVVGSISKTWTALAVLRLAEMGFLDLDDPLSDHLAVPAAWQGITLRQLLSHTSGLAREPVFHPALDTEQELSQLFFPNLPPVLHLGIHPRLVYPSYQGTPVVGFEPGNTARYSNAGAMILGAVVDAIVSTHEDEVGEDFASYESFVWRQVGVFDGNISNGDQMFSESLDEYWRQTDIPGLATGYDYDADNDQYVETDFQTSSLLQSGPAGWEGPAGGWTMTIGDLVRLMAAIRNDDVIAPATRQEMMTAYGQEDGADYGLGVFLIQKLGRPVFMHAGVYPGFQARYTVWPGESFGVAVLCNETNANVRDLTDDIGALFIGGGGIGGGGIGGKAARTATEPEPGDDPGLGAERGERTDPLPDVGDAERRRIAAGLRHAEREQKARARDEARLARVLARRGCTDLAADLVAEHGAGLAEPILRCFDAPSADGRARCFNRISNRLFRSGILDRQEKGQLRSCLALSTSTH